ncbi:MAG: dihydropteroate synthase [Thermoplasmata archaeon]
MRVRVRTFRDLQEAEKQIADIGAEPVSIDLMAPKTLHFNLLIENVRAPVAIIIKESMLAVGADAAINRNAITGKIDKCNVLVMATRKQLRKAATSLKMQPFGIDELAMEMLRAADNYFSTPAPWKLPNGSEINFEYTRIMGVVNVTPDSFSGDGVGDNVEKAIERALQLEKDGADMIDIGGESTRPGAEPVDEKTEIDRVIPVIRELKDRLKIPISIDSRKPAVAEAAIAAGAQIVNDVGGLFDREMINLCARERVPVIAMHMKGTPKTMQEDPHYEDVVGEVMQYLANRVDDAVAAGIEKSQIAIDPGIGFGKRLEDNIDLIRRIGEFKTLGQPICLGVSRKSFIGKITGLPVDQRLEGSIAAACVGAWNGADIVRCHDVKETKLALQVVDAIKYYTKPD